MKKRKFIRILIIIIFMVLLLFKNSILHYLYPLKYKDIIFKYSYENNIDPYFVASVIKVESNFNKDAKSSKNAAGLMQMTPETAIWVASEMKIEHYKESMLLDPETNIKMGCWYLKDLNEEFDGNKDLMLAAYNGGRGNVNKWLKDKEKSKDGKTLIFIPFKETDKYVKKVNATYSIYKKIYP